MNKSAKKLNMHTKPEKTNPIANRPSSAIAQNHIKVAISEIMIISNKLYNLQLSNHQAWFFGQLQPFLHSFLHSVNPKHVYASLLGSLENPYELICLSDHSSRPSFRRLFRLFDFSLYLS